MSNQIDYGSYLHLDALLQLQEVQSSPEHPDELLFIVVHQASELWFKVLLHEMDQLLVSLGQFDTMRALLAVQRINVLTEIVAQQLTALDTLPPQRFAQFRGYLGSSSGSQSAQFRAIEATAGLRDEHFLATIREHGEPPAVVARALERPTLQSLALAIIEHEGVSLESLYTGPGPTPMFLLVEGLLEFEQRFARWRFLHVQLVERIIGPGTSGTGGTLGAKYLSRNVSNRFFPELWAVRSKFYGRA
ncbi:MAG TPA: tryptophan 2,3-dioxygenase family protein [Gemmatimonas sp.]|nr:tryptophan 2,3-dioxygenase family protein [Gemmatimonas sp.]